MTADTAPMLTVEETARRLGVSVSTVWRMIRRGDLTSTRSRGRRLVAEDCVARRKPKVPDTGKARLHPGHAILRFAGIGRSGGRGPGSGRHHEILDR
jgi:excisionase family DNA binding protein